MPVSLPMDTYERMQRWLERFGPTLGYSSSPGRYVQMAVLEKLARDSRELERLQALSRIEPGKENQDQ